MKIRACLLTISFFAAACGDDPEMTPADAGVPQRDDASTSADAEVHEDAGPPADGDGLAATHLWGFDLTAQAIVRVRIDDQSRESMVTFDGACGDQCPAYDLDPLHDAVYYTDLTLRELHKKTITGGEDEIVWTAPTDILSLQISGAENKVYVALRDPPPAEATERTIYVVDLATGNMELLVERGDPRFAVDVARGNIWYLRGSSLFRMRISDRIETLAYGGSIYQVGEFDLGPNGTIPIIINGLTTIDVLDRRGRNSSVLVSDPRAGSLSHLGLFADTASSKLVWYRFIENQPLPEMYYAESPTATPVKIESGFIYDIRFDSIPAPQPADPVEPGVPRPATTLVFTPCADAPEIECAELVVPIDHQNPSGPTATLPVRRRKALREESRIGVLTYDYGGPGSSFIQSFMRSRNDDGLAGSGVDLVERFDLVGFERRGIANASPRFRCVPPQPIFGNTMSEGEWTRLTTWWNNAHTDCEGHPLIDHLGSRQVAADIEALRIALGEEKINLLTWSYGTTVGATYAVEYPSSVRAIAMVSPTRPNQDSIDRIRIRSALEEQAFNDFFAWCALNSDYCVLAEGTNSAIEVQLRFDAVLADLDLRPILLGNVLMGRARVLDMLGPDNWFAVANWKATGLVMGAARNGDRVPLTEALRRRYASGDPAPIGGGGDWSDLGSPEISIFLGVHGLDRPFPAGFDAVAARALAEEMTLTHPYFGNDLAISTGALAGWPATMAPGLNLRATTAPPLMIVAATFDYATNYEFGQEMLDILANGSRLVTFEGHSHSPAGFDICTGSLVTDYFLDPARPPAKTTCAEPPIELWTY